MVEQALASGSAGTIRLLLADARYADGPLLARLTCVHGITALVRLPADRCLYRELAALAAGGGLDGEEDLLALLGAQVRESLLPGRGSPAP